MIKIKLKNRFLINIFVSILIVFICIFVLFDFLFNKSFSAYLESVNENKFEELRTQISYILKDRDLEDIAANIAIYAHTEGIQVEILDKDNKSLAVYNPYGKEEKLTKKSYEILQDGEIIGSMVISYSNRGTLSELTDNFKKELFTSLLLVGLISTAIGMLIATRLSRSTSKSIESINQMAKDFKNSNYDYKYTVTSNILEINELKNNMTYLGQSLSSQEDLRKKYGQNISHELRTPLTNLSLYLEAIEDGIIDFDEDSIKTMKDDLAYLNALVENLRLSFNAKAKITKNNLENFNLSDFIIQIKESLDPLAKDKRVKMSIKIQENVRINSDKEKIRQILYNLISNALKATDEGDNIKIMMKEKKDIVSLVVADSGIGIEEKYLEKIFERNFRVKNDKNKELFGSGLGLPITKDLIESLGGNIAVKSKPGVGTSFTITLPANL